MVFANNFYYIRGGSERVLFDEMNMLKGRGHEVAPFSRRYDQNIDSEYIKYFPPPLEYKDVTLPGKIYAALEMIYSKETGRMFGELLRDFKPDLIHAHNIYGRLTTSIIDIARETNTPMVMSLHDYKLICPSYLMLNNSSVCDTCRGGVFYHCLVARCHRGGLIPSLVYTLESYFNRFLKKYNYVGYFICPSRFLLEKHAALGIPREKLSHVPHFINAESCEPNYTPGKYILFVGRLSREKGIMTMLKAVKGLNVKLKIVGEGPMKEECESFVIGNEITNVEFLGYKTGDELISLYQNSAFLVFPSEWYEVVGMSVLEAFACGKPVIGSDIGAIPETVVNGETGLLFKQGDKNDLRAKIKVLVDSPSMVEKMGRMARDKVKLEFSPEKHYDRLVDLYRKVLS